jgi:hypothetical protein
LIVTYTGPIDDGTVFDPARLSGIVARIENKIASDIGTRDDLRPMGILRDPDHPLPYLAILLELGNESDYKDTGGKILCEASEPVGEGELRAREDDWNKSKELLDQYENQQGRKPEKAVTENLQKDIATKRRAMDSCNRYSIFVRGTSPDVYGILNEANIATAFATLLTTPSVDSDLAWHLRPLEHLGADSPHTAWTQTYVGNDED